MFSLQKFSITKKLGCFWIVAFLCILRTDLYSEHHWLTKNFKPSIKHQIYSKSSTFRNQKEQNNENSMPEVGNPFLSKSITMLGESVAKNNPVQQKISRSYKKVSNFTSKRTSIGDMEKIGSVPNY